jgi:hypothetical protein
LKPYLAFGQRRRFDLCEFWICQPHRRSVADYGDGLFVFDHLSDLRRVHQRPSDFRRPLGIEAVAVAHVIQARLQNRRRSQPARGVFRRTLVNARKKDHCADRAEHCVAAVGSVLVIQLRDVLIAERVGHPASAPHAERSREIGDVNVSDFVEVEERRGGILGQFSVPQAIIGEAEES